MIKFKNLIVAGGLTLLSSLSAYASGPNFYGVPYGARSLDNLTIGTWGNSSREGSVVSYKVKAKYSGSVNAVRWWTKNTFYIGREPTISCSNIQTQPGNTSSTGYAKGNGGSIVVELYRDSGGYPNLTTPIASTSPQSGCDLINGLNSVKFGLRGFSSSPQVQQGETLHIVFRNIASDSQNNYISANTLLSTSSGQPADSEQVLFKATSNHSWVNRTNTVGNTPIYELQYTDGRTQGTYTTEVWVSSPQKIYNLGGGNFGKVRQTFVYNNDEYGGAFSGVKVRLKKVGNTDKLKVQLLDNSGNELRYAYLTVNNSEQYGRWETLTWHRCVNGQPATSCTAGSVPSPVSLTPNQSYSVVLSMPIPTSDQTAAFEIFPLKDGTEVNLYTPALSDFRSGQAEYYQYPQSTSWKPWQPAGYPAPRNDGVLQLYLTR